MRADCALAIDIGASSGRHIVGFMEGSRIHLQEVYRFPNQMLDREGCLCWDTDALFEHIIEGLRQCRSQGFAPASLGIDTWGVDYVLLDGAGQRLGQAVAYRDERTQGQDARFEAAMSDQARYQRTGIAKAPYNTLYQLMADFEANPGRKEKAKQLLFMPCYLSYLLCGVARNEYTIASTSSLLNICSKDWDEEVLAAAGIPASLLGSKPAPSGTALGPLKPEIAKEAGFTCQVVLPACHDTASAYLAMPVEEATAARLSSGTWSLLGIVRKTGLLSEAARQAGFTNEGCHNGQIRLMQNLTGLWILQRLQKEWQGVLSHAELCALARQGSDYQAVFDPSDARFLSPENMEQALLDALIQTGAARPVSRAQLLYCVHHSLARCYQRAIKTLETLTGDSLTRLHIVGGGSQNQLLNQLTADLCQLPLTAGPVECSALGNLLCQLLRARPGLQPAQLVTDSFELKQVLPAAPQAGAC